MSYRNFIKNNLNMSKIEYICTNKYIKMAYDNIDQRRQEILELIKKNEATSKNIRLVAEKYKCSYSSVSADRIYLMHKGEHSLYVNPKNRAFIKERDKFCQYCGYVTDNMIIEHVIPAFLGGVAQQYNLVLACQQCNCKKRQNVVLPKNINLLAALNSDWANKIIELSKSHAFDTRKFNKGKGRKTNDPLITFRVSASENQVNEIGLIEAKNLAKKVTREAILTAFQAKIK